MGKTELLLLLRMGTGYRRRPPRNKTRLIAIYNNDERPSNSHIRDVELCRRFNTLETVKKDDQFATQVIAKTVNKRKCKELRLGFYGNIPRFDPILINNKLNSVLGSFSMFNNL